MTEYTKKQQITFIEELFYKLARALESTRHFKQFVNQVKKGERDHRILAPYGIKNGLTVSQAVKYFVCKYIAEGKIDKKPDCKNILWVKSEVFYGYSLYVNYRKKLSPILKPAITKRIKQYDYPEYMNS
ncbi:MAG: hypothetical protein GY861_03830 [bacterium]|nr:hypothetical protein [bacterium]